MSTEVGSLTAADRREILEFHILRALFKGSRGCGHIFGVTGGLDSVKKAGILRLNGSSGSSAVRSIKSGAARSTRGSPIKAAGDAEEGGVNSAADEAAVSLLLSCCAARSSAAAAALSKPLGSRLKPS
ncbi:hypothetical protein MY11210_002992 [Beauveria gryllotalpidicola]